MAKYAFKGTYDNSATYAVGDVVIYNEIVWHMAVATGAAACVPGEDTVHWLPIDQDTDEIVQMLGTVLDGVTAQISEKELILASSTASSTKKFKITVIDDGTIAAAEIE